MTTKKSENIEIWNEYWKKKSLIARLIELLNKTYFSKVFERHFRKAVGSLDDLKILEAGCGSGLMSSNLSSNGAKVMLLDFSAEALYVARYNTKKRSTKAELVCANIFKMPFKNNIFDVVWNQGVLEHFDNPIIAIKEMLRVTKPGGKLVIFVPGHLSPLNLIYMILEFIGKLGLWPVEQQTFFKEKYLKKIMIEAGCTSTVVKRLFGTFFLSVVGVGEK